MHYPPVPIEGRLDWLDALKGFSILMVVMGHSLVDTGVESGNWMYGAMQTFRMPFFIMLAGIASGLVMLNKNTGFWSFIGTKLRSIILPYACWILLFGFIFAPAEQLLDYQLNWRWEAFYQGRDVLWFLPCLFALQVLYGIFRSLKNRFKLGLGSSLLLLTLMGALLYGAEQLWGKDSVPNEAGLAWISNALRYYICYFLGILIAEFKSLRDTLLNTRASITICLLISLGFIGKVSGVSRELTPLTMASLLTGCAMGTLFIRFICSHKLPALIQNQLIFLGKNTLIIYIAGSMFQERPLNMFPQFNGSESLLIFGGIALIICYCCSLLGKFIELSSLLSTLLLGKKYRKS
ncbi:MAG: acyltransferase [Akkermansia sp.]